MTTPERDLLREARNMIRDIDFGYAMDELHRMPRDLCDEITELLDDGYDFETAECEEVSA